MFRIGKCLTTLIVMYCGCIVTVAAQSVVYVDQYAPGVNDGTSWSNAYTDLQTALDATPSGEIWVAAGTYTPAGPGDDRNAAFALQSGVAIYGGFAGDETARDERDPAANPTILSGDLDGDDTPRWLNGHNSFLNPQDNSYHVVVADGVDETAVLDGVVVTHGYAYRLGYVGPEFEAGGGILILNGDPTIANATIALNAGPRGGGVAVLGGSPVFTNTVFSENYADIGTGGAVYNDGTSVSKFDNCVFRANASIGGGVSGGGMGGAIYNHIGGEISVSSSNFVRNLTGYRTYSYSEGRTRGGAIASWGVAADVRNSKFYGNKSHLGGAIYGYRLTVSNSNFSGNQAHDVRAVGLAAAGVGGAIVALGDNYFSNTTVAGNTSTDNGAGMYTSGASVVANSILWNNTVTKFIEPGDDPIPLVKMQIHKGGGTLDILYSDVEGLFEQIPGEDPPAPENFPGSIDVDPLFADPRGPDNVAGTEDDDLRLTAGSPAIDAGDNASVPAGAETDLGGNDRFADDPATPDTGAGTAPIVDMGAYEFASAPAALGITWPGDQQSIEGDVVNLSLAVSNPSGAALDFSASGLPTGLDVDAASGLVSGILPSGSANTYAVTVTVNDGTDDAQTEFGWTVTASGQAPVITNPGDQTNTEGDSIALGITASDPDGDVLSYGATGLPSGLSIDPSTGMISGTSSAGSAGTYLVQVTVSDGADTVGTSFAWTIDPAADPPADGGDGTPPPIDPDAEGAELEGTIEEVGSNTIVVAGVTVWIIDTTVVKFEDGFGDSLSVGQPVQVKGARNVDGSVTGEKIQVGG